MIFDRVQIVDDISKETGITLWHVQALQNKLEAAYPSIDFDVVNDLKKESDIPLSSPIFLSKLDNIQSNTKFYYAEDNKVKEIVPKLFFLSKITNKRDNENAYFVINSESISYVIKDYASKWTQGYKLDIYLITEDSSSEGKKPVITIDESQILNNLDLINETLFG